MKSTFLRSLPMLVAVLALANLFVPVLSAKQATTEPPAGSPTALPPKPPQQPKPPQRPIQFSDLTSMRRLGGVAVSPDSRWALFTVTNVDLDENLRTPHLWMIPLGGGMERPLTASYAGELDGQFSPDGKQILFISARDGSPQIYLANFYTSAGAIAEPHRLTSFPTGAEGAIWSPDGKNILFTSYVYPNCIGTPDQEEACNRKHEQRDASRRGGGIIFTHLLFRRWDRYTGPRRSHLFLVSSSGGTPRDLTAGAVQNIPPFSVGEPRSYAFSPDSQQIAFEWNTDPDPALSTNSDIFTLDINKPGAMPVRISTSPGGDYTPRYSPDGKYIAFRSQARAGYGSDLFRLMLYDRETHTIRRILPDFDRWVDDFTWSPDSTAIYFVSGDRGEEPVFSVDVSGNNLRRLTALGCYGDPQPTPDGSRIIVTRTTIRQPAELYVLRLKNVRESSHGPSRPAETARARRHPPTSPTPVYASFTILEQDHLTHLNSSLLSQLNLPNWQHFWFTGAAGARVEGFLLPPPNYDPAKKYPVKFLIHGGPEGEWSDSWSYRWNAELFAASGYVVIMINPRGSVGYGQAFIDGVNGDWGGKPYIDLMRGLDYAETTFPFIAKNRECALGASYGGFMADWILGHTNRFRCIVSHDGMFDPESAYGTMDELSFMEWEFHGPPWAIRGKRPNRALYRRWSPMLFAPSFKTPTLVIHGQLDYRLDVSQSFALFTTLQRLHVPSEMLYFPNEGHWILQPKDSRLWYTTVNAWCDKYTRLQETSSK